MDALTTRILETAATVQSLETAMQLNEERFVKLCERYAEAVQQLRELRALAKESLNSGKIAENEVSTRQS